MWLERMIRVGCGTHQHPARSVSRERHMGCDRPAEGISRETVRRLSRSMIHHRAVDHPVGDLMVAVWLLANGGAIAAPATNSVASKMLSFSASISRVAHCSRLYHTIPQNFHLAHVSRTQLTLPESNTNLKSDRSQRRNFTLEVSRRFQFGFFRRYLDPETRAE